MRIREAIALLDAAPADSSPARINPNLTRAQAIEIVRKAILDTSHLDFPLNMEDVNMEDELSPLMEKRVLQVTRNRKRV